MSAELKATVLESKISARRMGQPEKGRAAWAPGNLVGKREIRARSALCALFLRERERKRKRGEKIRGCKKSFGCDGYVYCLVCGDKSWVYAYVQTHINVYIKYMQSLYMYSSAKFNKIKIKNEGNTLFLNPKR